VLSCTYDLLSAATFRRRQDLLILTFPISLSLHFKKRENNKKIMKFAQGLGFLFLLSLSGLSDQVYAECIESKEIPLEDPSAARKLAFSGFEPEVKRYVVSFFLEQEAKVLFLFT
jgi:hypothetical protein